MKYRPEIDGLRAVAVVPVIMFHAGFELFSGGFIGVDVFFVISGYLITTIILSEKDKKTFSIINFYERRARRILPVIFLVMACSLPPAWILLFSSDFERFSRSLVSTSLFSSNILFWLESGYWGATNELKPLLHTWSLAVEEQYYILFPIFLSIMWKFRKRWILSALIIIALASLFSAEWAVKNQPSANFFLIFTRAWELMVGAIIAFFFLYSKSTISRFSSYKKLSECMSVLGLILVFYALVVFNDSTPFPSVYALVPTLGTGLMIIFSTSDTLVGKILSNKLFVGIGLISYSAYLWHQPLFAFSRHAHIGNLSIFYYCALIVLTFGLSYLSWKYVEIPFRNKDKYGRKFIFAFSFAGTVLFICIGLLGMVFNGFDSRKTSTGYVYRDLDDSLKANQGLSSNCSDYTSLIKCSTGESPKLLLWGDSHAKHLAQSFTSSDTKISFQQVTINSCRPILNTSIIGVVRIGANDRTLEWAKECIAHNNKVVDYLTNNENFTYVILASPFSFSKNIVLGETIVPYEDNLIVERFRKTIDELRSIGKKPLVIAPTPSNGSNIGRCAVKTLKTGTNSSKCDFDKKAYSQNTKDTYRIMKRLEEFVPVVHLEKIICTNEICDVVVEGTSIYRDHGHLSMAGSSYLGEKFNFMGIVIDTADKFWGKPNL